MFYVARLLFLSVHNFDFIKTPRACIYSWFTLLLLLLAAPDSPFRILHPEGASNLLPVVDCDKLQLAVSEVQTFIYNKDRFVALKSISNTFSFDIVSHPFYYLRPYFISYSQWKLRSGVTQKALLPPCPLWPVHCTLNARIFKPFFHRRLSSNYAYPCAARRSQQSIPVFFFRFANKYKIMIHVIFRTPETNSEQHSKIPLNKPSGRPTGIVRHLLAIDYDKSENNHNLPLTKRSE